MFSSLRKLAVYLITQNMVIDTEITLTLSIKNGLPESVVILFLNPFLKSTPVLIV